MFEIGVNLTKEQALYCLKSRTHTSESRCFDQFHAFLTDTIYGTNQPIIRKQRCRKKRVVAGKAYQASRQLNEAIRVYIAG